MKLLIVDDERSVLEAVSVGLRSRWQDFEVYTAANGEQGLKLFTEVAPDLVVLDLNMPRMSGFELLEEIRRDADTPILMLTASGEDENKVRGLELGADDYLTKPFSQRELAARVKALLRRVGTPPPEDCETLFIADDLTIDFVSRQVNLHGQKVRLTPTEYRLLYELSSRAGRVLTFEELLLNVWGAGYENDMNSLKIYVSRLRRKLGDDPQSPHYILTERNVGYYFAAPAR